MSHSPRRARRASSSLKDATKTAERRACATLESVHSRAPFADAAPMSTTVTTTIAARRATPRARGAPSRSARGAVRCARRTGAVRIHVVNDVADRQQNRHRRNRVISRASAVDGSADASAAAAKGSTTLLVAGALAVGAVAATHAAGNGVARLVGSAALGAALAGVGYAKQSLDASGALAAIGVGFGSIYSDARFGSALAVFFFASSAATRVRSDVKVKIDEHFKAGGGRDWVQVAANGFVPTIIAMVYALIAVPSANVSLQGALASAFLGYYGCCCGDTFASELGVLSKSRPRLIIDPMRSVEPGTNGGVTALGWSASAAGGAAVGAAFVVGRAAVVALSGGDFLATCIQDAIIVVYGAIAGVFGSFVDSMLGATVQYSGFCSVKDKVVSKPGPTVSRISGCEVLSNSAVNLVSASITAVVAAMYVSI